ncbi:MAG: flavin reductase family protein [Spirochaetales bacterium]|jgi:flavin reductase (DIM6/NTAB) family NADH-FMN oxidoreductase RutF|nr:flavin reductase family protein [Spirochaetales bacterium]
MVKTIQPEDLQDNIFKMIGTDWMLVTAGTPKKWNTMTASWGAMGVLWNKKVCFCFVRDSRYTFSFMNENDEFTLSFFKEEHREALNYCGSHSGRDVDKAVETGLIPVAAGNSVSFEQARLVLVCKKIFSQDLVPEQFLDSSIGEHYPSKDYHRMYIGEIVNCTTR